MQAFNGNALVANGPNWATAGDYSGQLHHFDIVLTGPGDGNPFDGSGDTQIDVYADNAGTPFYSTTITGGYTDNFISFQGSYICDFENLTITQLDPPAGSEDPWKAAAWSDDASSGVDASFNYTHAYNFGPANTVINNVMFTTRWVLNPSVPNRFSTAGLTGPYGNDTANNLTSGGSRALANDFLYNGNPDSLTVSGLVPGKKYVLSLFSTAWDANPGDRILLFSNGAGNNQRILDQDTYRTSATRGGIVITYTYVATAETETVNITPITGGTFHIYGFANREFVVAANNPWSYAQWTDDASSGIDPAYAYTHAYTFGGNAIGATINTISFTAAGGGNPAVAGRFVTDGLGGVFGVDGGNTVTGASSALARSFVYDGFPTTFTLQGLTPGTQYVLSLFSTDWDGAPGGRVISFSGAGGQRTIDQDAFGPARNGIVISYTYTADSTGAATIQTTPLAAGSFHLYGFANRTLIAIPAPPTVTTQPQDVKTFIGDTVLFAALISGSPPLVYQWSKDGVILADQTNATLTLTNVGTGDSGNYSMTASNGFGVVATTNAALCVCLQIVPGLFSTGVDDSYVPLGGGEVDLHWALTASADPTYLGPDAIVATSIPSPPWLANSAISRWLAPGADQGAGNYEGSYTYTTYFDPGANDLSQLRILGHYAVDNSMTDILLNGVSIGPVAAGGFTSYSSFTITNGFQAGLNSLDFVMVNDPPTPNPTGLRVELSLFTPIRPQLAIVPSGTNVVVSWSASSPCTKLQSAETITGPWSDVGGATPSTNAVIVPAKYYRVIQ